MKVYVDNIHCPEVLIYIFTEGNSSSNDIVTKMMENCNNK